MFPELEFQDVIILVAGNNFHLNIIPKKSAVKKHPVRLRGAHQNLNLMENLLVIARLWLVACPLISRFIFSAANIRPAQIGSEATGSIQ